MGFRIGLIIMRHIKMRIIIKYNLACLLFFIATMMDASVAYSDVKTVLKAEQLQLISSDYNDAQDKGFSFIGASLLSDKKTSELFFINLNGMYSVGHANLSFLNVQEIYFKFKTDEQSHLFVGRKLFEGSQLDQNWNLGFFNPLFQWNVLLPETQGLTGIFWEKLQNQWSLNLYASSLFIPNQGASYEFKEGQFVDSNPWFQAPPQNVLIQGKSLLPVDYQIAKIDLNQIVLQTSYGASLFLGDQHEGLFTRFSGIYKPSNQLALGYKVYEVVDRVQVELMPKVYMENNFSWDLGYRINENHNPISNLNSKKTNTFANSFNALFLFSAMYSKPQNPIFESEFNYPEFKESLSYGPSLQFDYQNFNFLVGYFETKGGEINEVGPDSQLIKNSINKRFLYNQATQVKLGYSDIYLNQFKLTTSATYKLSQSESFQQIIFNSKLKIKGGWNLWINLLLIETADNEDKALKNSQLDAYRNLDQVVLGVSYDI